MSSNYSLNWSSHEQAFFTQRSKNISIDKLCIHDSMNILEIGCGLGEVIKRIATNYPLVNITGIDSSSKAILEAQRLANEYQLKNVRFIHADAHELPFNKQEFDLCFFQTVLMHLKNPREVLGKIVEVTRKGGRVIALAEGDWSKVSSHPTCPALNDIVAAFLQIIIQKGGDPFIGSRLKNFFEEMNLIDVKFFENSDSSEILKGKDLIENGYLDIAASVLKSQTYTLEQNCIAVLLGKINDWCNSPESFLIMPGSFGASGKRIAN